MSYVSVFQINPRHTNLFAFDLLPALLSLNLAFVFKVMVGTLPMQTKHPNL